MRPSLLACAAALTAACGPTLRDAVHACPTMAMVTPASRKGRSSGPQRGYYFHGQSAGASLVESVLLENPRAHDEAARSRRWAGAGWTLIAVSFAMVAAGAATFGSGDGRRPGGLAAAGGALFFGGIGLAAIGIPVSFHERTVHLDAAVTACEP